MMMIARVVKVDKHKGATGALTLDVPGKLVIETKEIILRKNYMSLIAR